MVWGIDGGWQLDLGGLLDLALMAHLDIPLDIAFKCCCVHCKRAHVALRVAHKADVGHCAVSAIVVLLQ